MASVEKEFREFVVGFADPLTRLAFLLTAGASSDPAVLSADALARVRRQWRDAETTGAPEPLAVDALLSALPNRRQFRPHGHATAERSDDADDVLVGAAAATVNHDAFRRPVAGAEVAADVSMQTVDSSLDSAVDDAVDVEVLHDGMWRAWQNLKPRQRVPLVFADPSVASRRLAGLSVPESFGSLRRQDLIAAAAVVQLRVSLAADPTVAASFANMRERRFADVLADTLRERALSSSRVIDPYPAVVARAQRLGRRAIVAVAAVLAVVVAGFVLAVQASQPTKATAAAAAASAARSGAPALVRTGPSPTFTGSLSSQGPFAPVPAARAVPVLVVPWATRGTAAKDTVLLAHLKSYFTTVHADASGQVQVLLATDTPTMRIAYVTSNSINGVIQSWFYGPVGSDNLVEGATSYGGSLLPDSILADGLIDTSGHEEYVVIAPPDTTGIQIADFDFDDPSVGTGFTALPYQNGIAVKDMTAGATAASFVIDVTVGSSTYTIKDAPDIQLRPQFTGSVTSDGPPAAPLPTPAIVQGHPDSTLLADALTEAAAWEGSNPIVAARPVVLWAGTDVAGTKLVVLRVKTKAYDLLIVEWSGAAPGDHAEYLVDSAAPDVPVAFAYRAVDGTRLGVISAAGTTGASRVELLGDGQNSKPIVFSSTGFASFLVPSPPSDPNDDGAGALGVVAHVQLLDAAGHPVTSLSVPPSLGG
ncbi:MAG TPA: hypothetical protein VGL75_16630 [Acidothermaceae bacterium]|jgi:hypothetical protein